MEFIEILKSIILGIIQGITEWLPISSTGHLILANRFLTLDQSPEFMNLFLVVIQFGSILAVVTLYFHKLNPFSPKKSKLQKTETWNMWFRVIAAVIPAAVIGLLLNSIVEDYLSSPIVIAAALIVYGILFIIIERRNKKATIGSISEMSYKTAFIIGLFQVLAMVPGTSRSGATILGAVLIGTSREVAAEFSFFLAVPVMFGASLLRTVQYISENGFIFENGGLWILLIGTAVSYIVSVFAIRFLMSYIRKHDFTAFGYYRIALGIVIIIYFAFAGGLFSSVPV